jgi:hypothetical protein
MDKDVHAMLLEREYWNIPDFILVQEFENHSVPMSIAVLYYIG